MPHNSGSDDDGLILIQLGVVAVGMTGGIGVVYATGLGWLVRHGIFITDNPVVAIPGTEGIGLDWPRLLVVAGIALVVAVLMVSALVARSREKA